MPLPGLSCQLLWALDEGLPAAMLSNPTWEVWLILARPALHACTAIGELKCVCVRGLKFVYVGSHVCA